MTDGSGRLDVTIVTWNSAAHLRSCLDSLVAAVADPASMVVTVVDNASGDDTVEVARAGLAAAGLAGRVVRNDVNVGFSAAANRGLAAATTGIWCVVNPDARCHPGALDGLVDALDDPSVGLASALLEGDGGAVPMAEPFLSPTQVLVGAGRGSRRARPVSTDTSMAEVESVHGAVIAVRTDDARSLGGYDERFRLFGEDMDLCRRIRDRGGRVVVVTDARVHHPGGASSSQVDDATIAACRAAATITFVSNHHGRWGARAVALALLARAVTRRPRGPTGAAVARVAGDTLRHGRPTWPRLPEGVAS